MNLGMCWCRDRPQTYRYAICQSRHIGGGVSQIGLRKISWASSAMKADNSIQTFQDALGGAAAEAITNSDDEKRPFQVGDDTFV